MNVHSFIPGYDQQICAVHGEHYEDCHNHDCGAGCPCMAHGSPAERAARDADLLESMTLKAGPSPAHWYESSAECHDCGRQHRMVLTCSVCGKDICDACRQAHEDRCWPKEEK